jgi:hypothetical protein
MECGMKRPAKIHAAAKLVSWNEVPSLRIKGAEWKELVRLAWFVAQEAGARLQRAMPSEVASGRLLLRVAENAVVVLSQAAKGDPALFGTILAKEKEWPILWTDHLDHRKQNGGLLELLRDRAFGSSSIPAKLGGAEELYTRARAAVIKLNDAAEADIETYAKVATRALTGWPIIWSDNPEKKRRTERLIGNLTLLERGPFRVFKGGRKALRIDMSLPMNKAVGWIAGIIPFLQKASQVLDSDSPSDSEYKRRLDRLFEVWGHAAPGARWLILDLRKANRSYLTPKELVKYVWDILATETEHPERIRDLRELSFKQGIHTIKTNSVDLQEEELDRLRSNVGELTHERALARAIKANIAQHLNWYNGP